MSWRLTPKAYARTFGEVRPSGTLTETPGKLAADGAATYKTKCAACHGPEGQGKVGPAVKGTTLGADQITDLLTKGAEAKKAPHKKSISGRSADDAKAVADYVKTLK